MTQKITELGGGMARAGLTTKYAKDTKWGRGLRPRNDTEDHGIGWGDGARRFARESREYSECKDDDFGNVGARGFHAKAPSSQRGTGARRFARESREYRES